MPRGHELNHFATVRQEEAWSTGDVKSTTDIQWRLPILYFDSGGIPEYCNGFGVSFNDDFENRLTEIIKNYDIYKEMIARKLALPPKYVTSILSNPVTSKKEVEFVISGLVS